MGVKQTLEILERVEQVATLAGYKTVIEEDELQALIGFDMGEGRRQMVYIRDTTRVDDTPIITIYSPCLRVQKGFFKGLSKKTALDLLKANEQMHFARFGVLETDKHVMVVASIDHLLDKLDPEEFEASIQCVAGAADDYEKSVGKDEF